MRRYSSVNNSRDSVLMISAARVGPAAHGAIQLERGAGQFACDSLAVRGFEPTRSLKRAKGHNPYGLTLGRDTVEHAVASDIYRRGELLHSAGCRTGKYSCTAAGTMRGDRIKRLLICRDVSHGVERTADV